MPVLTKILNCCLCLCAVLWSLGVQAQTAYPTKPITLVVPYPAGGSADILARRLGHQLGERLGQPVRVDNRAGAGTAIGAKAVANAKPDGYTLLWGGVTTQVMNPGINRVPFNSLLFFKTRQCVFQLSP